MSPPLLDDTRAWTNPAPEDPSKTIAPDAETTAADAETTAADISTADTGTADTGTADTIAIEPLPVRVVRSSRRTKSTAARIKGDHIEVRIPAWLSVEAEEQAVTSLVSRLERRRRVAARPVDLTARAQQLAADYDLPAAKAISWSDRQTTLWGSCTPSQGTIRISTRLAAVPNWVLDFVILHELTHLVEANHGPRFKALLDRYPHAQRAEGFLEAMSGGLADHRFTMN